MSYILKLGQSYISADGTPVASQRDAVRVPDGTRLVKLTQHGRRQYGFDCDYSPAPLSPDGRYDDTGF